MLKLKLQYFGHLMWRANSWKRLWCWERLKAEEEGGRGWGDCMVSLVQWAWTGVSTGRWWGTGRPGVLPSMGWQTVGFNLATEQQRQPFDWEREKQSWGGPRVRTTHFHVSYICFLWSDSELQADRYSHRLKRCSDCFSLKGTYGAEIWYPPGDISTHICAWASVYRKNETGLREQGEK